MRASDWSSEIDDFVKRYGTGIFPDAGTTGLGDALEKATAEREKYRKREIDGLSAAERDFPASVETERKKI
jgi:hypothetical protein